LRQLADLLRRIADRLDPPNLAVLTPPGFIDTNVDLECYECGHVLSAGEGRPTRCDHCGLPTTWYPIGTFAWRESERAA
jgi:hypothetical protein